MDLDRKRWDVLVVSIIINLAIGNGFTWSIFAGALSHDFGWAATEVALAATVGGVVSPITMIIGGKIQDNHEPKWVILCGGILMGLGVFGAGFSSSLLWLYVTYGVLGYMGTGLVYSCTLANAVKFFPDKRGFAAGAIIGGGGIGTAILSPIAQWLIGSYSALFAFKALGISYFLLIVIGSLFIIKAPRGYTPKGWEKSQKSKLSTDRGINKTWREMLQDPLYYALLIMLAMGMVAGLLIITQAAIIAQDVIKVSPAMAAATVSMIGLAMTAGKITWGSLSDKIGRYGVLIIMYALSGAMMFILVGAGEGKYMLFLLPVLMIAFCCGGFVSVFPALTADCFGDKNNGVNYGLVYIGFSIGSYIGPAVGAFFINEAHPEIAFLIAGAISIVGIIPALSARKIMWRV